MNKQSYFTEQEIECKCGCGFKEVQLLFLRKMNDLRYHFGYPIRPTSWCRCEVHNLAVGGSKTSSHPKGWACDMDMPTDLTKYQIIYYAAKLGFRGIGIAKTFIHLDDDPVKPENRIWFY